MAAFYSGASLSGELHCLQGLLEVGKVDICTCVIVE